MLEHNCPTFESVTRNSNMSLKFVLYIILGCGTMLSHVTTNQARLKELTEEQRKEIWKASVPCFKHTKKRIDLSHLTGVYFSPYLNAPPYFTNFGTGLCKWINISPESSNRANYFGGYFNTTEGKLYTYTGEIKYNPEDGIYNQHEDLSTAGILSTFNSVPCIVSLDTILIYTFGIGKKSKKCIYQSFVFSRNSKTAARDKSDLEECYKEFNIPPDEFPYDVSGCNDVGLF